MEEQMRPRDRRCAPSCSSKEFTFRRCHDEMPSFDAAYSVLADAPAADPERGWWTTGGRCRNLLAIQDSRRVRAFNEDECC